MRTKQAGGQGKRAGREGESRCARCGAPFHCGIADAGGCWCVKIPPLPRAAYVSAPGCLCERCLRLALGAEAADPAQSR